MSQRYVSADSHSWSVVQGDTFSEQVTYTNPDLDFTGVVVTLLLKKSHQQNSAVVLTLDSATNGGIANSSVENGISSVVQLTAVQTKAIAPSVYAKELSYQFQDGTKKTKILGTFVFKPGGKQ